ncbi:hypothetical protein OU995_07725 [Roseateles sp. SL47]|uniref:hypothetical protein n=1 Tax=Roseateles sp. SL47 TaxID=2995138 RepID=UPI00226F384B|nr:hypothetical protein [Roseateles sp. SL47]WAC74584.1 hypothetical protein OU995_07725 [Roseateles sp. SL47]
MAADVELGSSERDMLNEMVLNQVMDMASDPSKYSKAVKYDKEAWRGEDQDDEEEQHIAKPIDLSF